MGFFQFKREQILPTTVDEIWEFISSPANLKVITPDYMGFDITSKSIQEKMYEGMMISYKVSPMLKIKTTWVTEITHIKEGEFFVDEQRVGPYKVWHHEHHIKPVKNGIKMIDIVSYEPPFGILGNIANKLFITKKLEEIFNYRSEVLVKKYGQAKVLNLNTNTGS